MTTSYPSIEIATDENLICPIIQDSDPLLKTVSLDVDAFDSTLDHLIRQMFTTMMSLQGRGISAIQIGQAKRVIIARAGDEIEIMVNPMFMRKLNRSVYEWEGCLSIPREKWRFVSRPAKCDLTWQDAQGNRQARSFSGDMARVIQHEMDHLDGILITDKPDVKRI